MSVAGKCPGSKNWSVLDGMPYRVLAYPATRDSSTLGYSAARRNLELGLQTSFMPGVIRGAFFTWAWQSRAAGVSPSNCISPTRALTIFGPNHKKWVMNYFPFV